MTRIVGGVAVLGAIALIAIFVLATADDNPPQLDPRWRDYRSQMGITWSDNVFIDQRIAKYWLDARAYGYTVWAERHPPAARRLAATK